MGETNNTPPELYPGHAAELRRHAERIASINAAASQPLPGPLLSAYAHVPYEIGGFRIRPLVHADHIILTQLDSPLLKQLRGGDAARTPFTDAEGYGMIWHLSRDVRVVTAELAAYTHQAQRTSGADPAEVTRQVRARFQERATEEVGYTVGMVECGLLIKAVEREFMRAFSTVINYQPKASSDGTETFPTPPPTTTASAGGSTISAA